MRFFIFFILFGWSILFASVGKITVVSGQVLIEKAGAKSIAAPNTKLEESDSVVTKVSSSAQILFTDGTVITIGANTNFKVHEYLYEEGSKNSNLKVGVKEGAFKAITGKIAKIAPEKFKIEGKTVTIGIRGTKLVGSITDSEEVVACTKGAITIEPKTPGQGIPPQPVTIVRAGEITTAKDGKIEPPRAYTPTEIKKLENSAGGSERRSEQTQGAGVVEQTKTTQNMGDGDKNLGIVNELTPEVEKIVQNMENVDKTIKVAEEFKKQEVTTQSADISSQQQTLTPPIATVLPTTVTSVVTPSASISNGVNFLTQSGSMFYKRVGLSMTKLLDGRVLALGGFNYDVINYDVLEPEIYDPATKTWTLMPTDSNAWVPRMSFGAATLTNGKVLVAGGNDGWGWAMAFADLYDPNTNTWTPVTSMPYYRYNHAITALSDNKALAIGGVISDGVTNSVMMFDLAANGGAGGWSDVASMNVARHSLAAVTLKSGNVMALGGVDYTEEFVTNSAEIYNPTLNTWTMKANMLVPRAALAATVLNDGSVLAIGGYASFGNRLNSIEQYNPDTDTWRYRVPLPFGFEGGGAVTLDDGSVLLAGGNDSGVHSSEKTWIYSPSSALASANAPVQNGYTAGLNNGFFVGAKSDGTRVFGKIDSMLFTEEYMAASSVTGELKGSLSSDFAGQGYNVGVTNFDFSHFGSLPSGITTAVYYTSEDSKVIWGTALINNKPGIIGFAALPDKVTEYGAVYSEDDYSSWGYWEAATTLAGDSSPEFYTGYWVSGVPTDASTIQAMANNNVVGGYQGHVLGDTFDGSAVDSIVLNGFNRFNMTVHFGAANPIKLDNLQFETSKGWMYSQSTNLTNVSSAISINTSANTQGYTATVGNSVNTSDILKLQGKFYGPVANSTGGVFSGALTGSSGGVSSQRNVQGVFKGGVVPEAINGH